MAYSLNTIRTAMRALLEGAYPHAALLDHMPFGMNDLADQLVFELIKEEYKDHAPRQSIDSFIKLLNKNASNRKYTRAIQKAQHYRDASNETLYDLFGLRLEELERRDMGGKERFKGYALTKKEFLELKLLLECKLLDKLHGGLFIESHDSHEAQESRFRQLFDNYHSKIDKLEPRVNIPDEVITNTLVYYGTETHFLIDFLYNTVLAAEQFGFPDDPPVDRILSICDTEYIMPSTSWCPETYAANNCMLTHWTEMCWHFFADDEVEWLKREVAYRDCKQLKSCTLQRVRPMMMEQLEKCSPADKSDFIVEHYWVWDKRPNYEWTSNRIAYFKLLHPLVSRRYPKPHVK